MEVILLENVKNLGGLGKIVKVKPGFARNYLLPQKKAVLANKQNLTYFEERKEELHSKELHRIKGLETRAANLNGMHITIEALVSDEGKLYGSIGVNDIVDAIAKVGGQVNKQEVLLPHGSIRELGNYEIQLGLNHSEILVIVNLTVVPKAKH